MPKISVIMCVYNTDNIFLKEAIDSILNQTYEDFEFIIINDCTNKENMNLINSYKDARIVLMNNKINIGLTRSLNKGILLAKGKYIARMDSDDISLPNRFKKQVEFLESNKEIAVVGSYAKIFNKEKVFMSRIKSEEILKIRMMFYNCVMVHPTAMLNMELLKNNSIYYDESISKAQDYMLWADCIINSLKIYVIDEILLKYRIHEGQITFSLKEDQQDCAKYVQKKILNKLFNYEIDDKSLKLHWSIFHGNINYEISEYEKYFEFLLKQNKEKKIFEQKIFLKELNYRWIMMTIKSALYNKSFRGLKSKIFWKAIFRVNNWKYYYDNLVGNIFIENKKINCLKEEY